MPKWPLGLKHSKRTSPPLPCACSAEVPVGGERVAVGFVSRHDWPAQAASLRRSYRELFVCPRDLQDAPKLWRIVTLRPVFEKSVGSRT